MANKKSLTYKSGKKTPSVVGKASLPIPIRRSAQQGREKTGRRKQEEAAAAAGSGLTSLAEGREMKSRFPAYEGMSSSLFNTFDIGPKKTTHLHEL